MMQFTVARKAGLWVVMAKCGGEIVANRQFRLFDEVAPFIESLMTENLSSF